MKALHARESKIRNRLYKKNLNQDIDDSNKYNISVWKLLVVFVLANLVIINILNYWQPVNHKDIKEDYLSKQKLTLALYELGHYFEQFKINPDQNSYVLIKKSVEFNDKLAKLDPENKTGLSTNIEKIIAKLPSFKLYQQELEKIERTSKNIKLTIFEKLDNPETDNSNKNNNNIEILKYLIKTVDKIENIVQKLKTNYWITEKQLLTYHSNIEEIGLQIDSLSNTDNIVYKDAILKLESLFSDFNAIMPIMLDLAESKLIMDKIQQDQDVIVQNIKNNLRATEISNYNIDDKKIIIITMLLANILLFVIIMAMQVTNKTKKVYNNYKAKKEIYYLSYNKKNDNPKANEQKSKAQELEPELID